MLIDASVYYCSRDTCIRWVQYFHNTISFVTLFRNTSGSYYRSRFNRNSEILKVNFICFIWHHLSKSVFCFIISLWCRQKFHICRFAASGMSKHERICLRLSSDFSSVLLFSYCYNDRTWPLNSQRSDLFVQFCMVMLFIFPEIFRVFMQLLKRVQGSL